MRRAAPFRQAVDPVVILIDVVFHILIFFMIGGQLTPQRAQGLELVHTADLDPARPPDALVLMADGALVYHNLETDPAAFMADLPEDQRGSIRLIADRAAPAARLVAVAAELKTAGAGAVILVTEQALQ